MSREFKRACCNCLLYPCRYITGGMARVDQMENICPDIMPKIQPVKTRKK